MAVASSVVEEAVVPVAARIAGSGDGKEPVLVLCNLEMSYIPAGAADELGSVGTGTAEVAQVLVDSFDASGFVAGVARKVVVSICFLVLASVREQGRLVIQG